MSNLTGIQAGSEEIRSAMFADNMLLFTSQPQIDIMYVKTIFESFKTFSGLQINYDSSEVLPLPMTKVWQ